MPSTMQTTCNHINQFGTFFLINEAHFYVYSFAFIFLVRARNLNLTSKLKAL